MWRTCFGCDKVVSTDLIPKIIVTEDGKHWHFASIKESRYLDVEKLEEQYFCKNCDTT